MFISLASSRASGFLNWSKNHPNIALVDIPETMGCPSINQVRRGVREGLTVSASDSEPSLAREADQMKLLELRDLDRALARLPGEQRSVILLVGLEGMSYEAVAEIVGIPVGTVRSRLSRGRAALRSLMDALMPSKAEAVAAQAVATTRDPVLMAA